MVRARLDNLVSKDVHEQLLPGKNDLYAHGNVFKYLKVDLKEKLPPARINFVSVTRETEL